MTITDYHQNKIDIWYVKYILFKLDHQIMCDSVNLRSYAHKLMRSLWQNIKCASHSPFYIWFEYRQHRWVHLETSFVNKKIFTEGTSTYLHDNNITKSDLMDECAECVFDVHFLDKMDANMYLLGFENGVYDFETKKFRDGHPDDCITLSTGYAYLPVDDEQIHDVMAFFNMTQPDKEMRNYLLSVLSACLVGTVVNRKMHVFTGLSDSGAYQFVAIMKHVLGDYFVESDSILSRSSGKRKTNYRGRRMCLTGSQQKIDGSCFKLAVSGECTTEISKYGLRSHQSQLKLFMVSDKLPQLLENDQSIFVRLCHVPFLGKIDTNNFTEERYKSMRLSLFHLLVNCCELPINMPPALHKCIEGWRRQEDHLYEFLQIHVRKNINESVTITKLYRAYVRWHCKYEDEFDTEPIFRHYVRVNYYGYDDLTDSAVGYELIDD